MRNSMGSVLLVGLLSSAAWAGPVAGGDCSGTGAEGTAAEFVALGSAGCRVGYLEFRNFSFSFEGTGGAVVPGLADVRTRAQQFVDPTFNDAALVVTLESISGQPFGAQNGDSFTIRLAYDVLVPVEVPARLVANRISSASPTSETRNPAFVRIRVEVDGETREETRPGSVGTGLAAGLVVNLKESSFSGEVAYISEPGGAFFSPEVRFRSAASGPRPGEVPEPATIATTGAAIVVLAKAISRKSAQGPKHAATKFGSKPSE